MSAFSEIEDERRSAQREALARQDLVEPTEDERRNGWDAESLTTYLAERAAGQELAADPNSLHRMMARRPKAQNSKYNAHRWRG